MRKINKSFKAAAFLFIMLFAAGNFDAQDFTVTKIGSTLEFPDDRDHNGAVIKKDGKVKEFEPSGVEPIGNGMYLLIANDKDNGDGLALKIVEASSGKVIKALSKNFQDSTKNPKWEALAKDSGGNYYVIGSHNSDETAAQTVTRSRLFRFRLTNECEKDPMKFAINETSIREMSITDSLSRLKIYDTDPQKNGVKIEGLAVRETGSGKELLIGLREDPSKKDITKIYFAELPDLEKAIGITKLSLKPMFKFDAKKPAQKGSTEHFKLSSLEYAEKLKGFLIVTSTEEKVTNKFQGNALWFISDDAITAAKKDESDGFKEVSTKNIYEFDPEMKAEGITVMPFANGKTMRAVIIFDNDGLSHGALEILEITDVRK